MRKLRHTEVERPASIPTAGPGGNPGVLFPRKPHVASIWGPARPVRFPFSPSPSSFYCVGHKVCFTFSIKDTFFIFTSNLINLDIQRMSSISHYWCLVGRGQKLPNIFQCKTQPHSKDLFGQNVNSTVKLHEPLLTRSISHSSFSIHCTHLFLCFSCFYLSWNNKA